MVAPPPPPLLPVPEPVEEAPWGSGFPLLHYLFLSPSQTAKLKGRALDLTNLFKDRPFRVAGTVWGTPIDTSQDTEYTLENVSF